MADPIWLDTCTIGDVADGNSALESELKASGGPLLMVPKVQEELLNGNPFHPEMRRRSEAEIELAKAVVKRLNIQLDTMGSETDRRALSEKQFKSKDNGPTRVRAIEESDAVVLSQVGASAISRGVVKPSLITTDGRLTRNADARAWGVDIRLPNAPPVGRGGAAGSGGALPSGIQTIQVSRTTPGAGAANASASFAVFQVVDAFANYINDKYQKEEVNHQIRLTMSQVRAWQAKNPAHGALVAITFSRIRPNDDFGVVKNTILIHPGDTFQYISVYFALTLEQAVEQQRRPEVRPALGNDSNYKLEWSVNSYWILPVEPALETPVGTWRVRVSRWTWDYDFGVQGGVRWTDIFNQRTGKGTWSIEKGRMVIHWEPPSTTKESWDFPLNPADATGRCSMPDEGNFQLSAVKQS